MFERIGYLLDQVSLRNLCFLYFFAAPALQDNANIGVMTIVLAVGHLLTGVIVVLAVSERLFQFSELAGC